MIIQFCGMSGSGKTTLANHVSRILSPQGISVEVIDGDIYRRFLCPDLGFSKADRQENIRRLAFVAGMLARHKIIPIICAINPYKDAREQVISQYENVKTIYVECSLEVLIQRDTKRLYQRAGLPVGHPDRIDNLTGVNDPFEIPTNPDLILATDAESEETCTEKLKEFILFELSEKSFSYPK
jgi:adenylylsulfate kinase